MKRIAMKKVAIIPAMAALMTGCMGRGIEAEEYNAHIRQADFVIYGWELCGGQ